MPQIWDVRLDETKEQLERRVLADPHLGQGQWRCAGVDPGQVEQVPDQGAEPLGLGQGGTQGLVVVLDHAVDEVLEQSALGGQRGAQLV